MDRKYGGTTMPDELVCPVFAGGTWGASGPGWYLKSAHDPAIKAEVFRRYVRAAVEDFDAVGTDLPSAIKALDKEIEDEIDRLRNIQAVLRGVNGTN